MPHEVNQVVLFLGVEFEFQDQVEELHRVFQCSNIRQPNALHRSGIIWLPQFLDQPRWRYNTAPIHSIHRRVSAATLFERLFRTTTNFDIVGIDLVANCA